jgi:hypothetical protein
MAWTTTSPPTNTITFQFITTSKRCRIKIDILTATRTVRLGIVDQTLKMNVTTTIENNSSPSINLVGTISTSVISNGWNKNEFSSISKQAQFPSTEHHLHSTKDQSS